MKTKQFFLATLILFFAFSYDGIGQTNTDNGTDANPSNIGNNNTAIGYRTLFNVSTTPNGGKYNTAIGSLALSQNTNGYHNIALGYQAFLGTNTGTYNIGIGRFTLRNNGDGEFNIAIGKEALENNVSADLNVAIGNRALRLLDGIGIDNVAMGSNAGGYLRSGRFNVFLGKRAGLDLVNGDRNIFIGERAGSFLLNGDNNVIIGTVEFPMTPATATKAGNDTSNTIILATGSQSVSQNQKLYIHSNGYTGIGLGNHKIPQNRLELGFGITGTSGLRFRSYNVNSPAIDSNSRVLTLNANGDVILAKTESASAGLNDNIYTSDGTLAANRIVSMNNNRLMFDTGANGAIYVGDRDDITNNTNFPTTTGNYRLYVEGGILTEKVKVAIRNPNTNWADYVFDKDYELLSLHDVETYIKTNKHLPGIDSAENLVENGLDLADMQAKQMQKIEELTLYVIEQDKKAKKQSKEIEELKAMVNALLERE